MNLPGLFVDAFAGALVAANQPMPEEERNAA